ncbi:hypothetical protein L6R52_39765, partial [Myxococcota bacterium]|nr:hypothetical protein [Myxococcota bacterium]
RSDRTERPERLDRSARTPSSRVAPASPDAFGEHAPLRRPRSTLSTTPSPLDGPLGTPVGGAPFAGATPSPLGRSETSARGAAQAADAPGGRFGWGTVMIALVVGIMVGLAIGLVVARALWAPVEISVTPASPATITPE